MTERQGSDPIPELAGQAEAIVSKPKIRRTKRVGGVTYPTESSVFTSTSRRGEIRLRKDRDTELEMTPQEKLDFINACIKYARMNGRIDIMQSQLAELEKKIRRFTDSHPGLIGIESQRLGVSVSDVPEITMSPDPVIIREKTGSAFPQYGVELVTASIVVPEEQQQTGKTVRADDVERGVKLAMGIVGMDPETVTSNVKTVRKLDKPQREDLFEAVNSGLIPREALHIKKPIKKTVYVKPLTVAAKKRGN